MLYESFLHYDDAGNHTCTVTDGAGNQGTSTTRINIAGKILIVTVQREIFVREKFRKSSPLCCVKYSEV